MTTSDLTSIEICGGAGGQALGIERAGFRHLAVVEVDADACNTLRKNGTSPDRPHPWPVVEMDVRKFSAADYRGQVDLFAGGVPCPPFSVAGRQLGGDDERDLFPEALRLIDECNPRAVMLENVKGLSQRRFDNYRSGVLDRLDEMGYTAWWKLLYARDFRVPNCVPGSFSPPSNTSTPTDFHGRSRQTRLSPWARLWATSWQQAAGRVPQHGQSRRTRLRPHLSAGQRNTEVPTLAHHGHARRGTRSGSKPRLWP